MALRETPDEPLIREEGLFAYSRPPVCDDTTIHARQEQLPQNLTLHIGHEESLLERADQAIQASELVLAPVELHRRNIQRRLREARTPKDNFEFADPGEVGVRLLREDGISTNAIDRIDRLSLIRSVLSNDETVTSKGTAPSKAAISVEPKDVEQVRTEVENVTGFHPERIDAFRDASEELVAPIDADTTEILDTAVGVERVLRQLTSKAVSDVELIRRATRQLMDTEGAIWKTVFPNIERISLVGVSSVPAAHIDFLHAVLETTSVRVHIHFRRGTGEYLVGRIPGLLDINEPGAVVFE